MDNLVPIGRFSRMCRLSVKALRHYDELGLLSPAVVDPRSGYRYYRYGQANRAEAIRVLRSLDLGLSDIAEVLDAADSAAVTAILDRQGDRLEAEAARHRRMLAFLRRIIDREEGVMPYQVSVKEVPAQEIAAVAKTTTMAGIGEAVAAALGEIIATIATVGMEPVGPPIFMMDEVVDGDNEGRIEMAFPVATPFPGAGTVTGRRLAAATVAWTTHRGPYDEVGPAYHTIQGWIQEHGHEVAGTPREVYLNSPEDGIDPADYLTEVQIPIR